MEVKGKSKIGTSQRAGKRTMRTREKTARACGGNFIPVKPWRQRKQESDY